MLTHKKIHIASFTHETKLLGIVGGLGVGGGRFLIFMTYSGKGGGCIKEAISVL